ncbi:hypothetical protein HMPREF9244_00303 [Alloscardovia omnicolens F0580]|uniref:Uncharacterized protein n=1 Tax=Alloscardovia omnicolens F0580 TaxID=1321816 RepID=U1RE46_9BIFI|nr:hypothetical protein HMPREF9244_00303 [Alloscardovia omnicolens F0580]
MRFLLYLSWLCLVVNDKAFTSCDLSGQTALMSGATGSGERYGMRIK